MDSLAPSLPLDPQLSTPRADTDRFLCSRRQETCWPARTRIEVAQLVGVDDQAHGSHEAAGNLEVEDANDPPLGVDEDAPG